MSEIDWVHKDSTTIKEITDKETQQKVIEHSKDYIIEKLQQENKQLKEDKKKAYKYLKEHRMIGICKEYCELLAILGDKE